jgi:hypothetical protein
MSLGSRLQRLEAATGQDGGTCRHALRILYPPEDNKEPMGEEICPECGKPRIVLKVVYDER